MQVETKKASLETLSVTIQALHVSGKQMTLSVFKQLPEACPYASNGKLNEMNFWGVVRYSIKDSGDLWVVASKEDLLYRCDTTMHLSYARAQRDVGRMRQCINWWASCDPLAASWKHPLSPEHPFRDGRIKWTEGGLTSLQNDLLEVEDRLSVCQEAEASHATLCRLPQLFIAV